MNNSWPLDNIGLNCMGTGIWNFFNQCTVSPGFCIWGFSQLQIEDSIFILQLVTPVVQDYTHCSVPFYIRGMSIYGFWYPQGLKTNLPADTEGWLSFGGVKSYTQVFDCMGVGIPNHHIVQGSTVLLRHLILSSIYTDFKW